MPSLVSQNLCCGCSACANICPKKAITMEPANNGFLYPIIDDNLCINCKLCERACPSLYPTHKESNSVNAFLVQHKNDSIRKESTSGGAFTAICDHILKEGGIIYGASIDEHYQVRHIPVNNEKDLALFRNSKYVQSTIGNCMQEIKSLLNKGRMICFSGTPCQVAGLHSFLGKDYDNLITVDVVCHAVPSPLIFRKYQELIHFRLPSAHRIVFRDKKRGYSYSTMAWYDINGNCVYRASYEKDEWLRLFLNDRCDRTSCYNCQHQSIPRKSDITIWDCYNIGELHKGMDDNKGTTNVITWTDKGKHILESISNIARIVQIDPSLTINETKAIPREFPKWDMNVFYSDANTMTNESFFKKYAPQTAKVQIISALRFLLWKIGLHDYVRHKMQMIKKKIVK